MRLPDYTALGQAPTPQPPSGVADYKNATAPAEAVQQFGQATQQAGSKLQDMVNVADVNNVMANDFQPKIRQMAQQYYSLSGKAAMDAGPQYASNVQDALNNASQNLTGEARSNFMKSAQPIVDRELYRSSEHAGQQAIVYANTSHEAAQDNSITDFTAHLGGGDISSATDDHNLSKIQEISFMKSQGIAPDSDIGKYRLTALDNKFQAAIASAILSKSPAEQIAIAHSFMNPQAAGANGAPKDYGADYVKPYTPQQIADIKTKVAEPSAYDDLFQKFGTQYGIDPAELKLHAVVESSLNPKADNGKSQGLMQLSNGNVKALGVVDPFDPAQSIEGAAKLMAQNKAAGGSDTATADKMYYGGSNIAQQGKNTQQYAANLAAVRGSPDDSGNTVSPVVGNPAYMGFPIKPKTAETITQAALENQSRAERLQKVGFENRVDSFANDPHFTSMLQVPTDIQEGIKIAPKMQNYLEARASYNLKNSENIVDADTQQYGSGFYNVLQNVYKPGGITKPSDLYQYTGKDGVLTMPGVDALKGEIAQMNTPEGKAIGDAKAKMFAMGARAIYGDAQDYGMQDLQGEQLHNKWLAVALNDYNIGIKAGKSPTQLLDPESNDYVGKSISLFARTDAQRLHQKLQPTPATLDALESEVKYGKATMDQIRPVAFDTIKKMAGTHQFKSLDDQTNAMKRFGLITQSQVPRPE